MLKTSQEFVRFLYVVQLVFAIFEYQLINFLYEVT
jgi:hypothetical protein